VDGGGVVAHLGLPVGDGSAVWGTHRNGR